MTGALAAVAAQRVLPVVTIEDAGAARELAAALQAAGANTVEVTFRSDAAAEAIKVFAGQEFIVGAGTVRSVEQAEEAAAAGASFAGGAGRDRDVVERCADLGLTPLPGIATASELTAALALGISTVKLFPAEVVGGAALIRALAAPFPDARFVPTGGLNAENAAPYLELPEVLAIGGSWMVAPALLSAGHWDDVERLTREALAL
jgi:2-dehydro-3-deoxyphosphogluconate aldolase/(4S)-4-hydroxy-2-oxoglutarate aldolase